MNIEQIFKYHAPRGDQADRYAALRSAAKTFATRVASLTPPSREQSVALTNVQQAVMWANAAIAINEVDQEPIGDATGVR